MTPLPDPEYRLSQGATLAPSGAADSPVAADPLGCSARVVAATAATATAATIPAPTRWLRRKATD